MNKYLVLTIAVLVLPLEIYSQNIIRIGRSLRNLKPTYINRTIHTSIARSHTAIEIAKYQSLNDHTDWHFTNTSTIVDVHIKRILAEHTLKSPRTIYGPYNYVRTFSKISKTEELTTNRHLQDWRHISQVNGYNGAHHLINKYTLKIIHQRMKENGIKVNLSDMQNNAPAIFHPLHGDKRYQHYFHNPIAQLDDYEKYGMKVTVMSLLTEIDEIGVQNGLPRMPKEYMLGILKEAELWCRTYNLMWERIPSKINLKDYKLPDYLPEAELFK